jgi:Family of unknown function (DUF5317)
LNVLQMFLALVYLALLVTVPLAGGRLSRLAELRLRATWLALAAIVIQVVVISLLPWGSHAVHAGLHLFSYLLLGAFAWANRRLVGVPIISAGGFSNFLVIAINGGVMPADPDAVRALRRHVPAGEFANSTPLSHPKLAFLGDNLPTPASWPVHNIYSVGDVVIMLGVVVLLHWACGSRLAGRRRQRALAVAAG